VEEKLMNRMERIRQMEPRDRSQIEEMVVSSGKFNSAEIETALELVDEALQKGEASGYHFVVIKSGEEHSEIAGYACYGPTPLTDGAYDLYWIVVDPALQRKGFGRILLEYVEHDILKRGGRMIIIETSSQVAYSGTIRFYEDRGYQLAARIKNFYRIADDKLIFTKEVT
jgi:ribosomal protein S18 acetylase RimI-like enzyme